MLGPDDELVRIATIYFKNENWIVFLRVFIVMNHISNECSKHIMLFEVPFQIANCHQVVHCLHRIYDVSDVVIWVVLEVTILDLKRKECEHDILLLVRN